MGAAFSSLKISRTERDTILHKALKDVESISERQQSSRIRYRPSTFTAYLRPPCPPNINQVARKQQQDQITADLISNYPALAKRYHALHGKYARLQRQNYNKETEFRILDTRLNNLSGVPSACEQQKVAAKSQREALTALEIKLIRAKWRRKGQNGNVYFLDAGSRRNSGLEGKVASIEKDLLRATYTSVQLVQQSKNKLQQIERMEKTQELKWKVASGLAREKAVEKGENTEMFLSCEL